MKKRGGYACNLNCQVRIRIPSHLYNSLMEISEKRQTSLSKLIRELLNHGMKADNSSVF